MPLRKKISSAALFLLLFLFAAVFLSSPARFGQSVLNGLMLWLTAIVPTALPLLVVLSLMVRSPAFLSLTRRLSPLQKSSSASRARERAPCCFRSFRAIPQARGRSRSSLRTGA